jgi:hypothetical protein
LTEFIPIVGWVSNPNKDWSQKLFGRISSTFGLRPDDNLGQRPPVIAITFYLRTSAVSPFLFVACRAVGLAKADQFAV